MTLPQEEQPSSSGGDDVVVVNDSSSTTTTTTDYQQQPDIEDLSTTTSIIKKDTSSLSTVRIRKLKPILKKVRIKLHDDDNNDCEDPSGCCDNACSCNNNQDLMNGLFSKEGGGTRKFENKVVYYDDDDDDKDLKNHGNGAHPQCNNNDLNPNNYTVYLKTWGCSHNNSDSEYMAGLLSAHGFRVTTTNYTASNLVILNSCTVKGPSEQHFKNEIDKAVSNGKQVVLAGCVPQSDKSYRKIASVIGVQQIDKIVEVVEETLKGNKLTYISAKRNGHRSPGADLSLPKIRKNDLIEIIPISTGCLNNCTYCKTKLARGQLASYSIDSIVSRITHVCDTENIREIWLTSEDLGAWGIDLGFTIVDLLNAIVEVLPSHVMLRLGMTNPPYILDHLEEISKILSHPNVYEFLHIPVQSGSDSVLLEMKREYGRRDFERICDFMIQRHPSITLATDIICGYPTETDQDFTETVSLVAKYKFPVLFINQFYPRPGTPAARLKRIPTEIVKSRTRQLNDLFQSYSNLNTTLVGTTQRVLVTELAHDGVKLVGHNKAYQQVLIDPERVFIGNNKSSNKKDKKKDVVMGKWVDVRVVGVGKFSMIGGDAWVVGRGKGWWLFSSNESWLGSKIFWVIVVLVCVLITIGYKF